MTKSPNKLVLRKETLRALSNKELGFAVGGLDIVANAESGAKACPVAVMVSPK